MKRFLQKVRWVIIGFVGLAAAVFVGQNAAIVELQFLHFTFEARRAFIVGLCLAFGALVGWIIGASRR